MSKLLEVFQFNNIKMKVIKIPFLKLGSAITFFDYLFNVMPTFLWPIIHDFLLNIILKFNFVKQIGDFLYL